MGTDSDLVMVVQDRAYLPSKEHLYAILTIFDAYQITEFGFPPEFDREGFIQDLARIAPLRAVLPVLHRKKLEAHPASKSIGWGRWMHRDAAAPDSPTGKDIMDATGKIEEVCAKFRLGYPAAHACVFLETYVWEAAGMDLELGLPIRPGLSRELRQEMYDEPGFERWRKYYPDRSNRIVSLSDNDVVLRVLPELLLSPMGDEPEARDIENPDGEIIHVNPPGYVSHVLLFQQNLGYEFEACWEFIKFFQNKYARMLAELKRITGHEIFMSEFVY